MKTSMCWLGAARLSVLALLFLFCCSDPAEDEVTPKEEEETEEEFSPEDADAVLEAFSFTEVTKVIGSVPTVANTSLIKTSSKDTIYTIPGIKDLIRISHPESRPVKGIFFAAKGSSFYYDVRIDTEEKSDTVSVIIFEIDPEKIEEEISSGAVEVPIEITAYDDNGQPIDIIERILTVENPSVDSCNILEHSWHWEWSVILNMKDSLVNLNARGETYPNNFTFKDCCLNTYCPKYDANQQPYYDVEIPISLFYSIAYEWFEFYSDGLFYRETLERTSYISNPGEDPATFDPCTWQPKIDTKSELVSYYGTHDYVPGDTNIAYRITDDSCGDNFGCGYASRGGQLTTSCHSMFIMHGTEGQKSIRMYTRSTAGQFENELLDRLTFWL
ncbi:hypothetical protein [Chryseolinea sp. H1M3-3]|uniref:hypothetical protein n=1 Tax=Chryseolinea sp. H1M3-3 TaxID=3034144 RepID=UPI0023EAA262|nr:hypothetical protein [Chryseolinea sp. H1M3-3]